MKKALISSVAILGVSVLPLLANAATNYGTLDESVGVNKTLSVGLNPLPLGHWFLSSNSNPAVADVTLTPSQVPTAVLIKGTAAGSTTVSVCDSTGTGCMTITVTVSSVLGVSTTLMSHAVGSWVLGTDGRTVYYVAANGVIPIPTWKIFLSNGGTAKKIVPANDADMNLALLPLMDYNDSRVQ